MGGLGSGEYPSNDPTRVSVEVAEWTKPCNGDTACVEAGATKGGGIAVRDSKDPEGPVLVFDGDEFGAFVAAAKEGRLDHLCPETETQRASSAPTVGQVALGNSQA